MPSSSSALVAAAAGKLKVEVRLAQAISEFSVLLKDDEDAPLHDTLRDLGRWMEKRCFILAARSSIRAQSSSLERLSRLQADFSKDAARRLEASRRNRLFQAMCPNQREYDYTWRRERKKGTSDWILGHESYQKWRASKASTTIWLQGSLGHGKTVTMASIVADLVLNANKETNSPSGDESAASTLRTVSHYFCKAGDRTTLQADSIIGSLSLQTLASPALAPLLSRFLSTSKATIGLMLGAESCIDLLVQITPPEWLGVFVLDGLDETQPKDVGEVMSHLGRLSAARRVLLCCSSRPTSAIQSMAMKAIGIDSIISMDQADRSGDIRKYISAGIERWKTIRPFPPELEALVMDQLFHRSQGMFLWLSLQMEAICSSFTDDLRSEAEIIDMMRDLPKDLPEAFDRALLRVAAEKNHSKIFQLVAAASPPLRPEELCMAFNIEPGNLAWNPSTLRAATGQQLISQVGGSLLSIDEEDSYARFIHHSALSHLVGAPAMPAAAPFHFDIAVAELTLSAICITYLNYPIFETRVSIARKASFQRVPGAVAKSVTQWAGIPRGLLSPLIKDRHTRICKVDLERLNLELQAYQPSLQNESDIFMPYARGNWLPLISRLSEPWEPLMARLSGRDSAAAPGLRSWILSRGLRARAVPPRNGPSLTITAFYSEVSSTMPEFQALEKYSTQHIRRLRFGLCGADLGILVPLYILRYKTNVNVTVFMLLTSLASLRSDAAAAAIDYNWFLDPGSARELLETAAPFVIPKVFEHFGNHQLGQRGQRDCHSVVTFLVDYLPGIDALLNNGKTTLQTAVGFKNTNLALVLARDHGANPQLCIPAGEGSNNWRLTLQPHVGPLTMCLIESDINFANSQDETALLIAVREDLREPVEELLMRGADTNVADHDGVAPLHHACGDIVKLLLAAGANADTLGPNGLTPLMIASFFGQAEAVKTLLGAGASPGRRIQGLDSSGSLSQDALNLLWTARTHSAHAVETAELPDRVRASKEIKKNCNAVSLAVLRLEILSATHPEFNPSLLLPFMGHRENYPKVSLPVSPKDSLELYRKKGQEFYPRDSLELYRSDNQFHERGSLELRSSAPSNSTSNEATRAVRTSQISARAMGRI
ncbi:NACHT domain-containing protein [Colletotrichum higginsianum]|uniref:NACHT domain-containing protein n=1 Tax=Colletotrichum higginsianum (strain IMI 349063) TaxID=759273 RepID=H1VZ87_COLHI|nr:NACHT domain-containing protein [Colletotrichum higginsianum]